jgi:hypothetical protein
LRQKSNFLSRINAESTVQSSSEKYFALPVGQIIFITPRRPLPDQEGRFAVVTKRWARDAMDAVGRKTNDLTADGEVVWS